ncbi:hypothetical protein SLEP1_g14454 [Rubroshorea leprosula]|uniref:RING-type domain-containing protein n=1 Tax=Rubroshorea leprosula TaxID=152421 RepID=A0AAV5IUJ3_9ROSI|nr:hypothetical protein SLEP1_g14454 [Rubroshorea leprosula]
MSQLRVILQESTGRERGSVTTIIRLLREQMDGISGERRRRSFKERLGLGAIGCCGGATWASRSTNMSVRDDNDGYESESHQVETVVSSVQIRAENGSDPECTETTPVSSGMNLAAALAAERHFRATQEPEGGEVVGPTENGNNDIEPAVAPRTPMRVSLMRLLEETGGGEAEEEKGGGTAPEGNDWVCCVCMGRKKGAAFIPCGHTFCRVCSREVWLNRGSCPLCNRSILEILDIF